MKICIPELDNPTMQEAVRSFPEITFIGATSPTEACEAVLSGSADTIVSGLDYASRDVLLAYKDHLPLKSRYFSSSFVCERGDRHFVLTDGGVNKLPTREQLYTLVEDSAEVLTTFYEEAPRIAMLSYSTYGSGGKNPDLEKIHYVIDQVHNLHPDWLIDGEMQLDAAVSHRIAAKKTPGSPLKGRANLLVTPDLNSGNILYKALEQFGGFVIAGPLIQGFEMPLADLSRGSSLRDVIFTIQIVQKLWETRK